jgi:glycosyltransferase involved in cell wall biosynthesis
MLRDTALVSIVIPAYNCQDKILHTIKSVSGQSYGNVEMILCDDGSADLTLSIAREEACKDHRIIIVSDSNHGPAHARNEGIKRARGKYLVFVDSDDSVSEHYISDMLELAEDNDCDLVISGYRRRYADGSEQTVLPPPGVYAADRFPVIFGELFRKSLIQGPCWKMFRMDVVKENHVRFREDWRLGEDAWFVYSYLEHVKKAALVDKANYSYTIHDNDSLSRAPTMEKIVNNIALTKKLLTVQAFESAYDCFGEGLCGNYTDFCEGILRAKLSFNERLCQIKAANDHVRRFKWFFEYREKHAVRMLYRFLIKHNFAAAICLLTFARLKIKRVL